MSYFTRTRFTVNKDRIGEQTMDDDVQGVRVRYGDAAGSFVELTVDENGQIVVFSGDPGMMVQGRAGNSYSLHPKFIG